MDFDKEAVINAARTDIECEMPGAVLMYLANSIKEKHIQLTELRRLAKISKASTAEIDREMEANERVGAFLLEVINDNFGEEFLDMFIGAGREANAPGSGSIN